MCLLEHVRGISIVGTSHSKAGEMPRSKQGLSDEEVVLRLKTLSAVIEREGDKEIEAIDNQMEESKSALLRELALTPMNIVDEWIEMLRADTEMQTRIFSAKLSRASKIKILEAFWKLTEDIKEEAKERIKQKWEANSEESVKALEMMLLQGAVMLLESTMLVHMTKQDTKKVEQHYDSVRAKYETETTKTLKILSSKHFLKDHHVGRIVVTNKKSSIFVDINLLRTVDKVADDVISSFFSKRGFFKNPKTFQSRFTHERGLKVMPRGKEITQARLDVVLSDLRTKDPRNHPPVFHIKEESRRLVLLSPTRERVDSIGFEPLERSRMSLSQVEHPPLYKYRKDGKRRRQESTFSDVFPDPLPQARKNGPSSKHGNSSKKRNDGDEDQDSQHH